MLKPTGLRWNGWCVVMIIDIAPHHSVITAATDYLVRNLTREGSGVDQHSTAALYGHCFMGKCAEAAMAVALGHDPDQIYRDAPGMPDFPGVDVKAAPWGQQHINIRSNALRHDTWLIAACSVAYPMVKVEGWLPMAQAAALPTRPPAPGHTSTYVRLPLAMLRPFKVVARV